MTQLSLGIRNLLSQDTALRSLLGRSVSWDTWIFSDDPVGVKVEGTQKCLIVVTENGTWSPPNSYNTQRFPRVFVDIWADPTRNSNGSVKISDAKDKIEVIVKRVNSHLHTVDQARPNGMPLIWGTAEQIADKTGVVVNGSQQLDGPDYSPIRDSAGSFMGRLTYGVNAIS
jgi:hypothetical protein